MTPLLAFTIALVMPAASMAAGLSFLEGQSRIVGGVEAKLGELPSTVALAESGLKSCGATLIGPKLALTAGHCAWNASKDFTLRAGSLKWNESGIVSKIKKSATIRYAKLPKPGSDAIPGSKAVAAGWGRTSVNSPSELVVNLRRVTVPIVKRSVCNENYQKRNASVVEQMICAGEEGKDACAGDSGSSLYDEITKELIGIVSWGYECALAGFPGVYTRVGYFVDWIKKNNKPPTISSPRID
ncbi:hypothetical protein LOZ51_001285 [Ophidiomyces ophidiicola]|nr:hypothetical protein LOZ55_006671 [Ophidiomyces ophidiicola]KAI2000994.1 hypothetical protein LOZ51_001285 [Ophidiomyces ophidiicola]